MPFVTNRPLQDMINGQAATIAGRAITARGGELLADAVRTRTPIDTSYSLGAPSTRPRGTARDSIVAAAVRSHTSTRGRGWRRRVFTEDPIFPFIEWNTRPHIIAPTAEHQARAAAEGRKAMLRFPQGGVMRYAAFVRHPGTTGQHPFARAAAALQAAVGEGMFSAELEEFKRNLTASRVSDAFAARADEAEQMMSEAVMAWIRANTIKISQGSRQSHTDPLGGE